MKLFGLMGYPLEHSFSKKYFTAKFEKENIQGCSFELFPVEQLHEFPHLLQQNKSLCGLAVTIPYKETIMAFLNSTDEKARQIGAVNCIKFSGNSLKGYNTDSTGFERSLLPLLQPHHSKALVLGNGGSSRAVQFTLKHLNIPYLVVTRTIGKAAGFINYKDIDEKLLNEYPLVINATPVGMFPDVNARPLIPYHFLSPKNLLYDLIYTPAMTAFLTAGIKKAATIKNGYEMLVLQAEENWRIWNE